MAFSLSPPLVSNCRQAKTHTLCLCPYIHSLFNDITVSLFITPCVLLAFDNISYLSISIVEKAKTIINATQNDQAITPTVVALSPFLSLHIVVMHKARCLSSYWKHANQTKIEGEATVTQWIMHTHIWRSKRFTTYNHINAINEFSYASHNQISLYGNVWGRCACCFLQPLPSKQTHAHMHTPIKIPTCCSVLFGEAAKEMTFWLYYYIIAHTHTHTHIVCLFVSGK